jgi:hypothetical protein
MFDFLQTPSLQDGAPAGHHAIQFIRQWAAASRSAGAFVSFRDLPPRQQKLARGIVREIEAREDQPVRQISRDRVDCYVRVLSEEVQAISGKQFLVDSSVGRDLLSKLRTVK